MAATSVSRFINALGPFEVQDTNRLLIACVCVVAIANDLHPSEILESLAECFNEDDWDEIKEQILIPQFERQMGATAVTPGE